MTTHHLTCTVRSATRGACGAPAVAHFIGRDGVTYAECADHFTPTSAPTAPVAIGDRVDLRNAGRDYVGTVVKIGRLLAHVEFAYNNGSVRTVTVPLNDVKVAR